MNLRSYAALLPGMLLAMLLLGFRPGAATPAAVPTEFPASPMSKPDGSRWRIGYVESGLYGEYPVTLAATVEGLERMGWLGLTEDIPAGLTGRALWSWISHNARSHHIEFVEDAWWAPGDFDDEKREPMRAAITQRIEQQKDIDLILAMGTWAGQDMRALGPPVPTVVAAASDPIAAGIADSASDSGRDNLHARIEPERFQQQVRLFHEIVRFKALGIVYEDTEGGRSYGGVAAVEEVARELGFSIKRCFARFSSISAEAATQNALNCYSTLSREADAVYVTSHRGITDISIKQVAHTLEKAKVPSFSMAGSKEVEEGILLSLAQSDATYVGLFHARIMAGIFNGASPRSLNQLWVDPPKIALNLRTARLIGFDPPVDVLLAADEVYEKAP